MHTYIYIYNIERPQISFNYILVCLDDHLMPFHAIWHFEDAFIYIYKYKYFFVCSPHSSYKAMRPFQTPRPWFRHARLLRPLLAALGAPAPSTDHPGGSSLVATGCPLGSDRGAAGQWSKIWVKFQENNHPMPPNIGWINSTKSILLVFGMHG